MSTFEEMLERCRAQVRRGEARELLRGLDLDAVSCRCRVQRMTTIFLATGEIGTCPGLGGSIPLNH